MNGKKNGSVLSQADLDKMTERAVALAVQLKVLNDELEACKDVLRGHGLATMPPGETTAVVETSIGTLRVTRVEDRLCLTDAAEPDALRKVVPQEAFELLFERRYVLRENAKAAFGTLAAAHKVEMSRFIIMKSMESRVTLPRPVKPLIKTAPKPAQKAAKRA